VNQALRVCFGDASADTRQTVEMRVLRINQLLESAQAGGTFACEPAGDESCRTGEWDRAGYVKRNERDIIHVCPAFFAEGLEFRRWNLIHECAHLAGAKATETYYFYSDEVDCDTPTELKSSEALENADSYSRLVWCLSRGTPFSPVKPI
jgi:hypothetical protein